MLPPRVKEAQVLSRVVLHNGNCKPVNVGVSVLASCSGVRGTAARAGTLAPTLDPLL